MCLRLFGLKDSGADNNKISFHCGGEAGASCVARIFHHITDDLDSENWCLNFPMVHAASDLGLILVNHTVILSIDCLLTSSSAKGIQQSALTMLNQCVFFK